MFIVGDNVTAITIDFGGLASYLEMILSRWHWTPSSVFIGKHSTVCLVGLLFFDFVSVSTNAFDECDKIDDQTSSFESCLKSRIIV